MPEQGPSGGTDGGLEATRIRREIGALVLLVSVAAAVFVGTRQIAIWQRARNVRDAAEWYQLGVAAGRGGQRDAAVVAFRHASGKSRDNRQYAIALAHALAADGRPNDAATVLAALREPSPEDPEINLELARLAATRGDVPAAVRYYRSALYGVWPAGREDDRRAVRLELVRLLLQRGRRTDAVGELIALTSNLPETPASHVEAGQMMLDAGEPRRARDQFQRALSLTPGDPVARSGAGEASFLLGDYADARRYLLGLSNLAPRLIELRDLAAEVLARDPMAPRLLLSERQRRLRELIVVDRGRVTSCLERVPGMSSGEVARLQTALTQLAALEGQFRSRTAGEPSDTIEAGVDVLYRVEEVAADICKEPSIADKALALIGRANEARIQ
jgi:Flp pilus assembly protein TadD